MQRVFIALWPTPSVREALTDWRRGWNSLSQASLVPPERLHITLHFIGAVQRAQLAALMVKLRMPLNRFEINLGRAELWPHGVAVLLPDAVPAALLELHASLGQVLRDLGLPLEEQPFRPHVTLARNVQAFELPRQRLQLLWQVLAYALVESRSGSYRVLQRYP